MNGEQIKVDYASSTVTYIGIAVSGAVTDQKFKWSDRADSTKITYK